MENPDELKMSLWEHLSELRTRLLRCTLSVLVLGGLSLVFSKSLFGFLMQPVLQALPEGNRALVYTSGVEEINVLMKVGLYAGVFFTTPVLLHQVWGFVSPGLYPTERKFAGPFVSLGSLAFLVGAAFCYFAVLPPMFTFLLNDPEGAAIEARLDVGRLREREALRLLAVGEWGRAGEVADSSVNQLAQPGDGQTEASLEPSAREETLARIDGLGRLYDAVVTLQGRSAAPVLAQVVEKRLESLVALEEGKYVQAGARLDEAASLLGAAVPSGAEQVGALWKLEKHLAQGEAHAEALRWTRPMLTMREQLSLVLILLLTFGVIFELPILMALLAQLGVVKASFLMRYQRHAFVVCLIAAAVLTPTGDAVNLALMAGPMLLCYELGVLAAWIIEKQRAKRDAASSALAGPG